MNTTEVLHEVNAFDKSMGIDLKEPDIWADPENYLRLYQMQCERYIGGMACILNGLNYKAFLQDNPSGYVAGNDLFWVHSGLEWNTSLSVRNDIFRRRFISSVLLMMNGRISDANMILSIPTHSWTEEQIVALEKNMGYIRKFVRLMINPKARHGNIMLKMHEILSAFMKKGIKEEVLYHTRRIADALKTGLRDEGFLSKNPNHRFLSDDLGIYYMIQLAYLLCTDKKNFMNVLPPFESIEGATLNHDLIKLIEELGKEIIWATEARKYHPMFAAFLKSHPIIRSQYGEECRINAAVKTGIIALEYTAFVLDDVYCTRFISEMLKKGI